MVWSTKDAIDYCLTQLKWDAIYPKGVSKAIDISEKTKTVVFRVPNSRLEVAIPFVRKDIVSCYIPFASVNGNLFPNKSISELHPEIKIRFSYPREDGKLIAGRILDYEIGRAHV